METAIALKQEILKNHLYFKPLSLTDIPRINSILSKYPSHSCDYSIGGIFMWIDYFDYQYAIYDDTLFLMGKDQEYPFFYRPIGRLPKSESYEIILDYCKENGIFPRIISDQMMLVDDITDELNSTRYRKEWMEYLYDIDKFIGFPGKKMEKKRNHYNYFLNHYPDFKIAPISEKNFDVLKKFTESFEIQHGGDRTFDYESKQTLDVLQNFNKYPFIGLAIKIGDKIEGYTFGEIIGDTLFAHVEKGNSEIRGIYQILASSLCKAAKTRFPDLKYVNREEDMGYEALAKSKMSYHPSAFVLKHHEEPM